MWLLQSVSVPSSETNWAEILGIITPFAVAVVGITGTLLAPIFGSMLPVKRAKVDARAKAIVEVIEAWSAATVHPVGLEWKLANNRAGVAAAQLMISLEKRESAPIAHIVNYTTNVVTRGENRHLHIGAAQEALVGWHLGQYSAQKAFGRYREVLLERGVEIPDPPGA